MNNTNPHTVSISELQEKYDLIEDWKVRRILILVMQEEGTVRNKVLTE